MISAFKFSMTPTVNFDTETDSKTGFWGFALLSTIAMDHHFGQVNHPTSFGLVPVRYAMIKSPRVGEDIAR